MAKKLNNPLPEPTGVFFDEEDLDIAKQIISDIDKNITKLKSTINASTKPKLESLYAKELKKINKIIVTKGKQLDLDNKTSKEFHHDIETYFKTEFKNKIYNDPKFNDYQYAKSYPTAVMADYNDELKPFKDVLSDVVNTEFFASNKSQIQLLKTVFHYFKPWLDKHDYKLIFYGGNLMRLISNNIRKYLDPYSDDIIQKIFLKFVKKNDNDFTLMTKTTTRDNSRDLTLDEYNSDFIRNYNQVLHIVSEIRNELDAKLPKHFEYFRYNDEHKKRIMSRYLVELNKINKNYRFSSLKINAREDQILLFGKDKVLKDPKISREDSDYISLFNNKRRKSYLYCSFNNALEFFSKEDIYIKFALHRIKFNFLTEVDAVFDESEYVFELNLGGEVVDVGVPHLMLDSRWLRYNPKEINGFVRKKTHTIHNDEYDFDYTVFGLHYQVELLMTMIYVSLDFPWLDPKYEKRIARIVYYEFFRVLDQHPVSTKSLKKIKKSILNMNTLFFKEIAERNKGYARKIKEEVDDREQSKLQKKYDSYISDLDYYINAIGEIIDSIIIYFEGGRSLEVKRVFDLDIE